MKTRSTKYHSLLALCLAGCGSAGEQPDDQDDTKLNPTSSEEINLNPTSQQEAAQSLARINELQDVDPDSAIARDALAQLMPRLDELNHLVVRVEARPGHFVSFYEPSPGHIAVSERAPANTERVLSAEDLNSLSIVDLYRRLAKTEPPDALVQAHERQLEGAFSEPADDVVSDTAALSSASSDSAATHGAGVGVITQALTEADGPWFAANGCFKTGDFRGCLPNWWNGGFAQANTKTSFFTVAPFSGNLVFVRVQYQGVTQFTDPVFPGQWLSWWYHSASQSGQYLIRLHRWDILEAAGDGFHWSYSFKWNCNSINSCNTWP
jgi:hypothetical protein